MGKMQKIRITPMEDDQGEAQCEFCQKKVSQCNDDQMEGCQKELSVLAWQNYHYEYEWL
jgi:hypothetical protein